MQELRDDLYKAARGHDGDLYNHDFHLWTQYMAEQLRVFAQRLESESGSSAPADLVHLIEEVEDLGIAARNAVRSGLRQAVLHLLKVSAWPTAKAVNHWLVEADEFLSQARDAYRPSMYQHLHPEFENGVYPKIVKRLLLLGQVDGKDPRPVEERCPVELQELLDPKADVKVLATRFSWPYF